MRITDTVIGIETIVRPLQSHVDASHQLCSVSGPQPARIEVKDKICSVGLVGNLCLPVVLAFAFLAARPAWAQNSLTPSAAFIQGGWAGDTRSATAGAMWDWSANWELGGAEVTGYLEGSLSRWSYETQSERRSAWLAQVGLIPVLRFRPNNAHGNWFIDLGVGLTMTSRIYQTEERRFSTRFNFGDHLAIGRSFGTGKRHEIALRAEHFSNGGVREPNPGVNFLQLRYSVRLE